MLAAQRPSGGSKAIARADAQSTARAFFAATESCHARDREHTDSLLSCRAYAIHVPADGGRLPRPGPGGGPRHLQTQCTTARRRDEYTLEALREELDKNNVDAFVIPSDDPHLSEYVAPCFERRAFASGFTGKCRHGRRAQGPRIVLDRREVLAAGPPTTRGRLGAQGRAGAPGVDGIAAWFGTAEAWCGNSRHRRARDGIKLRLVVGGARSGKAPRGESGRQGLGGSAGDALVDAEAASFGIRR